MKKYILTLAILVGFNGLISAQFKLPSNPLSSLSEKSEPSGDVNASQEALMSRVADAIGDTIKLAERLDADKLVAVADTYGNAGAPSTNYGTSTTLASRGNIGAISSCSGGFCTSTR